MKTLAEFITEWNWKEADFDGYYGPQCVDIVQYWVKELGIPALVGDPAYTIWNNYDPKYFTRIENGLFNSPMPGDIAIWKPGFNGGFGHIAIVVSANVFSLSCFSQNDPLGSYPHTRNYSYGYGTNGGIYGWLHPKVLDKISTNQFFKLINGKIETQITDTAFRNWVRELIKTVA
jgi:hypothetical protein